MDLSELKQRARELEQQGHTSEALAVYQQVLAELDAIGAIRNELPLLIKVGDLLLKSGDASAAVDMYERAAEEYATQGAAQPVSSLCVKVLRADPQYLAVYLRMARKLLDNGHTAPARDLLMDYAQRAKLGKTRQGLEKLAGRPEDEVKRVLEKAISTAEQKVPPRPRRAAPAPPPEPPPEPPTKRLTVPVGAMDAEPAPDLLQAHPPKPAPEPPPPVEAEPSLKRITVELGAFDDLHPPESPPLARPSASHSQPTPELTVPRPEDLQAPVLPPAPPVATPPHTPPRIDPTLAPLPLEPSLPSPRSEPTPAPPPAEPAPRPAEPPPRRPSRASVRTSVATARPRRRTARGRPGWLWPLIVVVVLGGGAALVVLGIIPAGPLRSLLSRSQKAAVSVARQATRAVLPGDTGRSDTIMARDTAGAGARRRAPARAPTPEPAPRGPQVQQESPPAAPPTLPAAAVLPPGITLRRSVIVVQGLTVEGVREISQGGKAGFEITQVLPSGGRVMLHEFLSDSAGSGEISVSGLAADTVIGTTWYGGFAVTLRGVLKEETAVQLLQQLVEVRPR